MILTTNIPFAIWTPVPEGSRSPSPTRTPSIAIPTLRPSTHPPSVANQPTNAVTPSPTTAATTLKPTGYPTSATAVQIPDTAAPTPNPTSIPTSYPITPPPSSLQPTLSPTRTLTVAPVSTEVPTYSPTEAPKIWQLGFPKLFSRSMDSALLSLAVLCGLLWIGAVGYMIITAYRKKRWSFQTVYDSISPASTHSKGDKDKTTMIGGLKRRKIVQNKYEDYWGEDSEDTLHNFPTRASTLGAGYSYGTVRSLPLSSRNSNQATSYEDYWDENIDFSIRSTDSFGLK